MSLDKFTKETVNDLIFDLIKAVGGRYHKRHDKSFISNQMSLQKPKTLHVEIWIDALLE